MDEGRERQTDPTWPLSWESRLKDFTFIVGTGMIMCIRGILVPHYYPSGLMYFLRSNRGTDAIQFYGGYAIYGLLLLLMVTTNSRRLYRALIFTMLLLTLLNVIGCNTMASKFSRIGQ